MEEYANKEEEEEQPSSAPATNSVTPLTLGIISEPPSLVLIYEELAKTEIGEKKCKKRKRKIPLRQFTDKSNAERFAFNVRIRHETYLGSIPPIIIEKMLRIIQEIIKGFDPGNQHEAAVKVHSEYEINPNEDLNKLSTNEVCRKKLIMDESFERNRLKPTDPGYKYDKQVDFDVLKKISCGWDEDEEAEAQGEEDKVSEVKNCPDSPEHDKIETCEENDDEDDFW